MIRARCLIQVVSTIGWPLLSTVAAGIARRVGVDRPDALTVSPHSPPS
ncbi:hypothetical protein FB382_001523 [Nocardioides ginsengisegetis]|uniref:Uncharacterized protein n=1 Tax=Nocardioides ginsengisegetis TaxID=661491 RepID=A0A7W3P9B0_9ACTN|nr:hypothetical protein [Nocardioides ginsengisegetis]